MTRRWRWPRAAVPALLLAAGCGPAEPAAAPAPPQVGWQVTAAPHAALWYHGMAHLAPAAGVPGAAAIAAEVLPVFRPGYVEEITAEKRRLGIGPTPLETRGEEFDGAFAGEAYATLAFLPLYFQDWDALRSGLRVWDQTGGDPRRAASPAAAQVIAFLSRAFPQATQRRNVLAWFALLEHEAQLFYTAHWSRVEPELQARGAAVAREWEELRPGIAAYLEYARLRNGELLLVPALGPEGRAVTGSGGSPAGNRIAVAVPPPAEPAAAVYHLVHELLYPLAGTVVREQVAPARLRESGEAVFVARAAIRAGALLLDHADPARAAAYRRVYLAAAGHPVPPAPELAARFAEAFPLPDELAEGLAVEVRRSMAGI
jgi:hypothetical protein